MSARTAQLFRILFVARPSPRVEAMATRMKSAALDVTLAFTPDSAVALCLGNHFAAVILDAALIRDDDWTVARSLKLIKPRLPIVLLDSRSTGRRDTLPSDIDLLASSDDPDDVLLKLRGLFRRAAPSKRRLA